jgi:NAD(P)-dependent dehydrogenase (short-subunit alcohol dehydrogenase family)
MMLKSKVVIVTGAGSGIGKSIARAYAEKAATVILVDKNESKGRVTETEIILDGYDATFIKADVSVREDIVLLVKNVIESYNRIDIVINNAGISRWKSPFELSVDEWDEILNTNLRSVFLLSREAARHMQEEGGAIVNIASTRAFMSEPYSEAYAASKGGILSLTHALAASFAGNKISVNSISPGWIETSADAELREIDHSQHFAGRVGRPEDIARACLFLTSPGNDFITATNLTIDGGMTRKMIYEPD